MYLASSRSCYGSVWLWHQVYGYWQHDGVPTSNMATFLVMLDEATKLGGCLYFIPGSHKLPVLPASKDETTTSYPQWAIHKDRCATSCAARRIRSRLPAARELPCVPLQDRALVGPQSLGERSLARLHGLQSDARSFPIRFRRTRGPTTSSRRTTRRSSSRRTTRSSPRPSGSSNAVPRKPACARPHAS